ncbi:UDP-N-acetylmuramate dehydrogenase [Plasticicumulans sp.]|uniref:UDP-N-acetylmuramate dehydrogenase n=1 Tax=Plasticicumulans sp. TaxID=2307179 RepID=UPI002BB253D4|nr:UDP-N-acetylmuramate dehydrogenase [Plasticicumulans sp.]MBS0603299.1 UDP-N-acetylmuramate dehydrogenase [Pseudomonadota bacterium]HMW30477.1 UDP-N-acetylmuramate dehydrogenase [Plasticicumulans sp.]HMW43699.1 UDP-N-acetylmuramate dehydrogenase [Plasticicumulans sp.]HND97793.1 UDP-N-acetylmuramate dehydrogenase [Plasticicumulans sp.]HNE02506.1 UDP-N-acetylmuramate dehydrogenase [Plasticicumulans sp.]
MTAASVLQREVALDGLNTFGLPARAEHFLNLEADSQLAPALAEAARAQLAIHVLGAGSNVLLAGDVAGLVIRVALCGRRLLLRNGDEVVVEAGAGEDWHGFVAWTLANGWFGLENLALIPGTVGGSPIQNIGAYGVEAGERIAHVDVIDLETGQARRLMPSACGFGYRDSVFKHELAGRVLVVAVAFRLSLQPAVQARYAELNAELQAQGIEAPTPQQVFEAVCAVRRRKLPEPAVLGNAGSFFKNPVVDFEQATRLRAAHPELVSYPQPDGRVKLAAGWLIERCGWKGRALGRAGVYERQALVLVNHGGATGAEVLALAEAIRADVRTRFGVALEMEPVRMGG